MVATLPAIYYEAPLVNPSPGGLYAATTWPLEGGGEGGDPPRFMGDGVIIRNHNYGGEDSTGVWDVDWCAEPGEGDIKSGTRPTLNSNEFPPIHLWGFDQCDLTGPSRNEVRTRAAQNLRLQEQQQVEKALAYRLIDDTSDETVSTLIEAVAYLETQFGLTGTVGFIHAGIRWAAVAAAHQLLIRSGGSLKTPLGHTWVFGGGYDEVLGYKLVATSPTFGWRTPTAVRDTIEYKYNQYVAIAERTVVVGYEKAIAAADVDTD